MVMTRGKQTCRLLKEIRRQIAETNGIHYITSECRYKGDCRGTCPKCEAEVRWLERKLRARSLAGKAVSLVGISASLLVIGGGIASGVNRTEADIIHNYEPAMESVDTMKLGTSTDDESIRSKARAEAVVCGGVDDEDNPFAYDTQAEFPGGIDALLKFLMENVEYPEDARKADIQGRVVVRFIVNEAGRVTNAMIAKSVHPLLDEEALRVVKKLPRFIPAQYKGKNKASGFALPINFSFTESTDSLESVAPNK